MLYIVSIIGMVIVAIVLMMGIWNMAKGGSPSKSQKLMRLRIMFQFVAVIAVMTALYFSTKGA
ncbi:MAG: twin transmembrane helix small protein [Pseudomonadota bacterium]